MFQKTERAATIFFSEKKTEQKSNLFRSFGPFWPHNFEPIFGSVLGGQNDGPGGGESWRRGGQTEGVIVSAWGEKHRIRSAESLCFTLRLDICSRSAKKRVPGAGTTTND